MSDDKSISNLTVLVEQVIDQNNRVLEAVESMRDELKTKTSQTDLEEVKADIKAIKAAVTDTNRRVQDHEQRITQLEAAA